MAQTKNTEEDEGSESGSTLKSAVVGGLLAILIGGGSGFGLGYFTGAPATAPSQGDVLNTAEAATPDPADVKHGENQDHDAGKSEDAADVSDHSSSGDAHMFVTALEPIVTNLSDPKDMWIRLELVMTSDAPLADDLPNQIHQDLFAHVRAMRLSEMAGPSAFIDLKAELLARARQRSEGHVQKVYVKTLLYE